MKLFARIFGYISGELIPNHLALGLVKAEMSRHQNAKAFFLEGFPREARQVENFEREVRKSCKQNRIAQIDDNLLASCFYYLYSK